MLLLLLTSATTTACVNENFKDVDSSAKPKNADNMDIDDSIEYTTDPYTGVEYVIIHGGITVRVDKNGKPIINPKWLKDRKESEK